VYLHASTRKRALRAVQQTAGSITPKSAARRHPRTSMNSRLCLSQKFVHELPDNFPFHDGRANRRTHLREPQGRPRAGGRRAGDPEQRRAGEVSDAGSEEVGGAPAALGGARHVGLSRSVLAKAASDRTHSCACTRFTYKIFSPSLALTLALSLDGFPQLEGRACRTQMIRHYGCPSVRRYGLIMRWAASHICCFYAYLVSGHLRRGGTALQQHLVRGEEEHTVSAIKK